MATLSVLEVLVDPNFTSPVTLLGSQETYDENGNPVWVDLKSVAIQAVVTRDTGSIPRLPEALRKQSTILVRFPVSYAPEGFRGGGFDKVVYKNRTYLIQESSDWGQFTNGFYCLVCVPEEVTNGKD